MGKEKESAGTSLFSVNSDFSTSLVASSRRRPPEHPMDQMIAGEPFALIPAKGGGVILGAWGQKWTFLDSTTGQPPDRLNQAQGNVQLSSSPDLIVRCKQLSGDRDQLVRVESFSSQGEALLLADPQSDSGSPTRFTYPRELGEIAASQYAVAWDGKLLWILAWSNRGSPLGATEAWIFRISDSGYKRAPLRFVWPSDGDQRVRAGHSGDTRGYRYPVIDPKGIVPTDHGLVITGRGMSGFWYLPYADLEKLRLFPTAVIKVRQGH